MLFINADVTYYFGCIFVENQPSLNGAIVCNNLTLCQRIFPTEGVNINTSPAVKFAEGLNEFVVRVLGLDLGGGGDVAKPCFPCFNNEVSWR